MLFIHIALLEMISILCFISFLSFLSIPLHSSDPATRYCHHFSNRHFSFQTIPIGQASVFSTPSYMWFHVFSIYRAMLQLFIKPRCHVGRLSTHDELCQMVMMMMYYELIFWKQKKISLCVDVLHLTDRLSTLDGLDV